MEDISNGVYCILCGSQLASICRLNCIKYIDEPLLLECENIYKQGIELNCLYNELFCNSSSSSSSNDYMCVLYELLTTEQMILLWRCHYIHIGRILDSKLYSSLQSNLNTKEWLK